jgi:hypothetical protein
MEGGIIDMNAAEFYIQSRNFSTESFFTVFPELDSPRSMLQYQLLKIEYEFQEIGYRFKEISNFIIDNVNTIYDALYSVLEGLSDPINKIWNAFKESIDRANVQLKNIKEQYSKNEFHRIIRNPINNYHYVKDVRYTIRTYLRRHVIV